MCFLNERIRDLSDIDLLVNATPIGMQGRGADFTPVEEPELTTLKAGATVYDIIYNPKKDNSLKLSRYTYEDESRRCNIIKLEVPGEFIDLSMTMGTI